MATAATASLEAHRTALLKCALTMGRSVSEAEDLVQRTFERALRAGVETAEPGKRRAWLRTILKNLIIDDARRTALHRRTVGPRPDQADLRSTPTASADPIGRRVLRRALSEIREDMAQALLLVAVEGFTYVEVAALQGVPVGTVKSRVARARRALAEIIRAEDTPAVGGGHG